VLSTAGPAEVDTPHPAGDLATSTAGEPLIQTGNVIIDEAVPPP
jgi:hypothetical protein